MKIVGLVGPKRSGKSTAAAALVQQRGFVEVGFADAVKALALRTNPIVSTDTWGPVRLRHAIDDYGWEKAKGSPEVRRFLQELGTGVRDIVGESAWIEAWYDKILPLRVPGIVVPDVRFINEVGALRALRADWETGQSAKYFDRPLLIRVTRPGLDLSDTHVSETEQAGIECDVDLINSQTPDQLQGAVLAAVDAWL